MDFHPSILFILGIGVFGGVIGALTFQRLKVPQVVGYIAIGLLIGQTGLGWVGPEDVDSLQNVNYFALGIIGFLVGGELEGATFRKYGRQFVGILLGEGLAAFVLVGLATGGVLYLVTHDVSVSAAAGIVFGAIASATDPASTIDVLREYRTAGGLTTAVVAVVALDDALAMTLYGLGSAIAVILVGGEGASLGKAAIGLMVELGGAVALGLAAGFLLNFVLRRLHQPEKALAVSIGAILLIIAAAARFHMDIILASMTAGVVLVNAAPLRSKKIFATVRSFSTPIYIIFFVLVGARLSLGAMPSWLWLLVGLYVVLRSAGKALGTYLGARATGAEAAVRRYAGMGLFAQGGVAVGLSIMAGQKLAGARVNGDMQLGDLVVFVVTATTLVVQVVGPPMVKLAAKLAGEIGRDVREEDVVATLTAGDVMRRDVAAVPEQEPVGKVLERFSDGDHLVYPVVDQQGKMIGLLTLETIRNLMTRTEFWTWMVAADVMEPVERTFTGSEPLQQCLDLMRDTDTEQVPVVDPADGRPAGILDARTVRQQVKQETIKRRAATA